MSFTDQKPRIATEREVTRWGGAEGMGRRFRCHLCGHKFKIGDYWRWIQATKMDPCNCNFLVCKRCDGPNILERWESIVEEWKILDEELRTRFWWALDD